MTNSLRNTLKGETEYVQAHTYLITSPNFEKAFNSQLLNHDSQVDQSAICKEMYRTLQEENLIKENMVLKNLQL